MTKFVRPVRDIVPSPLPGTGEIAGHLAELDGIIRFGARLVAAVPLFRQASSHGKRHWPLASAGRRVTTSVALLAGGVTGTALAGVYCEKTPLRMALLSVSATKTLPAPSTATPWGKLKITSMPAPLAKLYRSVRSAEAAMVLTIQFVPTGVIFRMVLLYVSAT